MLRFIDSFEHYNTSQINRKWNGFNENTSGDITISATGGRNDGPSLKIKGYTTWGDAYTYIIKSFDSQATWIIGFRFQFDKLPSSATTFIQILDNTTAHIGIDLLTTGGLKAYRGSTEIASSSSTLSINTLYYFEIKATIDDSSGVCQVNINGSNTGWINFSGDTRNGANASANKIRFNNLVYSSSPYPIYYISDLYIADSQAGNVTDLLGDCRVDAHFLTADGYSSQFTPSTGSNYQNVDDNPSDDGTTYNSSSTAGHIDTYKTVSLGFTPTTIQGVQYILTSRKDDGGTRGFKRTMRKSSSNYQGSTVNVMTSYTMYAEIIEDDPATATNFTKTDLESNIEWGLENV